MPLAAAAAETASAAVKVEAAKSVRVTLGVAKVAVEEKKRAARVVEAGKAVAN